MTGANKIVIAAAGSGKTTYLVKEAVRIREERVLVITYTESNEAEIRRKFFELVGHVPANVVITTWFSFLITHGVMPFQGSMFDFSVAGMVLVSTQSGLKYRTRQDQPVFWAEEDIDKHYFDPSRRIYSDKLAKLAIRCNGRLPCRRTGVRFAATGATPAQRSRPFRSGSSRRRSSASA